MTSPACPRAPTTEDGVAPVVAGGDDTAAIEEVQLMSETTHRPRNARVTDVFEEKRFDYHLPALMTGAVRIRRHAEL